VNSAIQEPPLSESQTRSHVALHLIFLIVATGVFVMSFLMRYENETRVFLPWGQAAIPSVCSSKVLFGIDCPGCGLTRAFIAISHAHFTEAWNFNPASYAVYLFVAAQIPWHLIQLWRLRKRQPPLESSIVYLAPIGLVLVLFTSWLVRLPSLLG
jgi:uncharacterized membrane protein SirB2